MKEKQAWPTGVPANSERFGCVSSITPRATRADHWCEKGHVLFCLEGELHTKLMDGRVATLRPGMSYQVGDGMEAHRSYSPTGAKLFIVD
uniref:Cupin 2, conserved barrel domain protein n=1 Tax=Solibacter usitatus (strain Ellin6076) TaxID=234267 RepID=Q01TJ4_SOLUE